ncbi:hypothetical protein BASA83_005335 [Batrachochytrium salamandrivorans]|nr:hypothetical protein BASA83_005335 [Batrachochytrium salamandrivorans]
MEEILANLTARLKSLELENESLKVESHEARDLVNRAILGNSLNEESSGSKEPKASLPEKFDGTRKKFRGFINQLELLTADLDWNDAALRSQFRIGLSSEI